MGETKINFKFVFHSLKTEQVKIDKLMINVKTSTNNFID